MKWYLSSLDWVNKDYDSLVVLALLGSESFGDRGQVVLLSQKALSVCSYLIDQAFGGDLRAPVLPVDLGKLDRVRSFIIETDN